MSPEPCRSCVVIGALLACGLLAGCHSRPKAPPTTADLIGEAQKLESWNEHDALQGLLFVTLGHQGQVEAKFLYDIQSHKMRLELPDDARTVIVFDGHQAWVSPVNSPVKMSRASYLAWVQLVSIPFRLKSAGAQATDLPRQKLGSRECLAVKLTPGAPTVGAPGDWYIVFADPQTRRVEGIAFSQGYGKAADELDLRAVTFYDFRPTSDIRIGTEWKFWQYNKTEGIYGMPIGSARLLNLEFIERPKAELFTKPANARLDEPTK